MPAVDATLAIDEPSIISGIDGFGELSEAAEVDEHHVERRQTCRALATQLNNALTTVPILATASSI